MDVNDPHDVTARRSTDKRIFGRRALLKGGCLGVLSLAGCLSGEDGGRIETTPDALVDERIAVQVDGVAPAEPVTIRARARSADDTDWDAFATFEADDDGRVVVSDQPPRDGTYTDVDPMGLFWSMWPEHVEPGEDLPPDVQFIPGETAYEVRFTVEVDGHVRDETTTTRRSYDPGITHRRVDHDELVGEFFAPSDDGPAPGVLHLHGAGGEIHRSMGRLLASRGFATLLLQYFGDPDPIPDELVEVPLEYVETAMDWLRDHERVRGPDVRLFGFSRGGELALLVASRRSEVGAVIGWVPSGVVWEGVGDGWSNPGEAAWLVDGKPLPFLKRATNVTRPPAEGLPLHEPPLAEADADELAQVTIPVENIEAPIYLVSATDDRRWPSTELSRLVIDRLDEADHEYEYTHDAFEDAGHFLMHPYLPTAGTETDELAVYGGTPAANAHANSEAWAKTIAVLREPPLSNR